jgi:hypothetical protein
MSFIEDVEELYPNLLIRLKIWVVGVSASLDSIVGSTWTPILLRHFGWMDNILSASRRL